MSDEQTCNDEEMLTPYYIDLEVAEGLLAGKWIDVNEATGISDDAAETLGKYLSQGVEEVWFNGLTDLSDRVAEAFGEFTDLAFCSMV